MANPIPQDFNSAQTVAALTAAAAANGGSDYKCLIGVFLFGGADSHNMVIPTNHPDVATLRAQYAAARPVPSVGVDVNETPFNRLGSAFGSDAGSSRWRLHPKLQNLVNGWYPDATYGEQLAVVRNVGTLDRPLSKAEYLANPKARPDQLFAHNIQQDIWQAADIPDKPRTTGWFGRAMNLMDPYFNPTQSVSLASYMTGGERLQGVGYADKRSNSVAPVALSAAPQFGITAAVAASERMRNLTRAYGTPRNLMYQGFNSVFNAAVLSQTDLNNRLLALPGTINALFDAIPTVGVGGVANNPIKEQVRTAARVIHSRGASQLNQRRQVILLSFGGWDHHSSLRTQQDRLLEHLDNALSALINALGDMGLLDRVTIFTESEFSRTLQSNGTGGTDHGWAGHQLVIGGAVKAGFYGPDPDYTINGPRDTGQGRFIPDVSTEQYYATLLKWFGIPEAQLPLVLPNLPAFTPTTLGFL